MRPGIGGKIALLGMSALQGGYMLFDGTHYLLTGSYFDQPANGPVEQIWAAIPRHRSPARWLHVFVVLGALWLIGAFALLLGLRWSRPLLVVLSIISLAYLIFGTLFSIASLAILLFRADRVYAKRAVRHR